MASEQAFRQPHRYRLDTDVRGSGPALLLAHGAGGGIEGNFGLVLDDLARDHTVIGPSYPGVGRTLLPEAPLDLDALADALAAAAVEYGHERFVVIGESLGSAVAIRAATRHPERVTALVLTAGFAVADPALGGAAQLIAALGKAGEWRAVARLAALACLSERRLTAMSPEEVEATVEGVLTGMPSGTPAHFELITRLDVRDELDQVRVPTLVAVPTGARLVLPDSSRRITAGIARATLVEIPGAGHILDAADRAVWLGHVRRFLAGLVR
ncbi:alpha/beta fold hydrolase [Streptomyces pinistramenti]|uniref:alpha/beta fold hydrolase n=1 Tax=Streptomyces pinistramenti TaxID=2884812 RepID=UPI001D096449|nr:alpha/beta fold hydrolase [Streptomyces pinistramenti]MCB5906549.1 alpha/beta hydrolase [Streptomyces pinistramenti]